MRLVPGLALGTIFVAWAVGPRRDLPTVQPNPNTHRAGVLHGGVLTLALEAKQVRWQPDGPGRPAMTIEAFAEEGRSPLVPGPLVRAPQRTEIRLSVRNSLTSPLTFFVPAAVRGVQSMVAQDSIVVAPGSVRQLTTRAAVPGNYLYRAASPSASDKQTRIAGALAGAIVIDTAGATPAARDRVFVLMETPDSVVVAFADTAHETTHVPRSRRGLVTSPIGRFLFTINGRSWPKTERIAATVGDSLHWRIINASADDHPMHLHGFYYRVDAFAGPYADSQGPPARGQLVVTQLLSPFSTMSMTWSPDRPANWIFHCHFAQHLMPDSISAAPNDPHMRGMVGLILGITVAGRPDGRASVSPTPKRHLRLVAIRDTGFPDSAASMRFVLEEHGRLTQAGTAFSPTIDLTRGEPVSIMIVNHLDEPTSVHWHGIEVEDSYVDGVPGVSGSDRRLAPAIAPGDSFEARFTPPRSGTFIYHAHIDEVREQQSGLEGALIVRDLGEAPSPDDHVVFLKGSRFGPDAAASPLEINGEANPDTIVLHVGRPARLRFISLASINPNATVWFTARADSAFRNVDDTMVVHWRAIAKDGADLPPAARGERLARQIVSMGETYDFEYTPSRRGTLRLEVRALPPPRGGGVLLARVPVRIE